MLTVMAGAGATPRAAASAAPGEGDAFEKVMREAVEATVSGPLGEGERSNSAPPEGGDEQNVAPQEAVDVAPEGTGTGTGGASAPALPVAAVPASALPAAVSLAASPAGQSHETAETGVSEPETARLRSLGGQPDAAATAASETPRLVVPHELAASALRNMAKGNATTASNARGDADPAPVAPSAAPAPTDAATPVGTETERASQAGPAGVAGTPMSATVTAAATATGADSAATTTAAPAAAASTSTVPSASAPNASAATVAGTTVAGTTVAAATEAATTEAAPAARVPAQSADPAAAGRSVNAADASAPTTLPASTPATPLQPSATASAAPTPAPAPAPVPQGFAAQLTRPIAQLRTAGSGEHIITVNVTPENLGPVTVRAHIGADGMRIELHSASDAGRDALKAILGDLRRDLASLGVHTPSLTAGGGQQGHAQSQGQPSATLDLAGGETGGGREPRDPDAAGRGSSAGDPTPGPQHGTPTLTDGVSRDIRDRIDVLA
ncbi:flagellar hook-length control protein FliK [Salinibacterium sp. SYSU T00001]|uniref:flagellar hook-length control protein FliK n=1 Tax=Homoserinimonas sedimenticola TaxID=2986805 RepID=UPI0022362D08|nr:flagellar hook-length control protein FliK [Salinibacterium sedimenticola]MCW4385730.1 flagellar hook-length control protein FliK [Salinibacterium sedimenticola]